MSRFFEFQFLTSTRIAFIIVVLQFSGTPIVVAQRYLTTFGLVSDLRSGHSPEKIVTGDFNGDGVADLAVVGGMQVRIMVQSPDSLGFVVTTFPLTAPVLEARAAALNGDRYADLVIVTDHPPAVQTYLGRRNGKFFLSWQKELAQPFEKLLVADINSDRKADLIFYGKKQLGITVYEGNGDGTFRDSQTIFPDYSFSALAVESLRDNGLNDLIASNWISNEVLVFSGFGRMKFSEPSILQCPGEVDMIAVASIDTDMTKDLVVTMPDQLRCETFAADGLGGFRLMQTIALRSAPTEMVSADLNDDGRDDICLLDPAPRALTVLLNDGNGELRDEIPFDAGRSPAHFVLFRHQRSTLIDAAVLDTLQERVRVLYNSTVAPDPSSEQNYALGLGPTDVLASDITNHRLNDIAVADGESGNLALFVNRGDGTFAGQIPFNTSPHPSHLDYLQRDDSLGIFLTSSAESRSVTVVELNVRQYAHSVSPLPTLGPSDMLLSRIDPQTRSLHIFTLEHDAALTSASCVEFEQIANSRFIERSFSLVPSMRVLSAVMGDFDGDGSPDIAFAAYDDRGRRENIYQSRGLPGEQFSLPRLAAAFAESTAVPVFLWSGDMNADGRDDLLLNFADPLNRLELFLGNRDTTLTPAPLFGISDVAVASTSRLRLVDINGDGRRDIVLDNKLTRSIQVWPGKGDGTFLPGHRLMSTEGVGGFTISDLDKKGRISLIVTDSLRGVLRIIPMEE